MKKQTENFRIGIYSQLSEETLQEIREFTARCTGLDGYETHFYWDSIENRKNQGINDITCHLEDDLIGYFALYYFVPHEIEITFLIHPDHREPEIYSLIWEHIEKNIAEHYQVNIIRYTFTCHEKASWSKDFIKSLGAKPIGFTYKLVRPINRSDILKIEDNFTLKLKKAEIEDIPILTKMEVDSFHVDSKEYEDHLNKILADPNQTVFVASTQEKIIGKIHISFENKNAFIYDFCVAIEEQKKGYGTLILNKTIAYLVKNSFNSVSMEVTNEQQLNWYKKFNFKHFSTYEHWKLGCVTFH